MQTHSKSICNLFTLIALLASLAGSSVIYTPARAAGTIRFAAPTATGSNDCLSWASACLLRMAIDNSLSGDQIWVQAGTNKPTTCNGSCTVIDRMVSFKLKNGVAIYGGFAGTETQLNQRNPAVNVTILSGNIGMIGDNTDNSFHVVRASNTGISTILDGFTIRDGNANGDTFTGGGMYNDSGSSPTLTNLIFSGNSADLGGGGMLNEVNSGPTLTNVTFSGNSACGGGGIDNRSSSLKLTNVTFSGNSACNGGGMINTNSNPTLTNVTFSGNSASISGGDGGGGMFNSRSSPILTNVTFSGNSTLNGGGGGMLNENNSSAILTNVTFSGNSASSFGGGMANSASIPTLTNATFSGNSAGTGGGMFNDGGGASMTDVTFSGNSSDSFGGGLYNSDSSIAILTNVTFSGNTANTSGGGIQNSASASATLTNVTFSGNSAPLGGGIYNVSDNSSILVNTLIANSLSGGDCVNDSSTPLGVSSANNLIENASNACRLTNGVNGNIIGVDPNLGPLANNGGPTQTHALLPGSPAIDKGKDANCPTTDQRGVHRPVGSHCDIGSYESRIFTISGNAGTADVTLSYINGISNAVISQPNGVYSLMIPEGWSGTVTPSHPCFTFNPSSQSYNTVLANQTAQNYGATFNAASGCANINVKIGGGSFGPYGIPSQGSLRVSYASTNNGPVKVTSTNGKPIIAAERVITYSDATKTKISHFSELMALPLTSTTYAFPAYDNSNFASQLRFANVTNSPAHVHVVIHGVEMPGSPFTLNPGASSGQSFIGINNGPVKIMSDQNIVASLRVINKGSTVTSFSEMMGLPANQWNTTYWMPWYNNVSLRSQLRIGNLTTSSTAHVHVLIGGAEMMRGCTIDGIHPLNSPFNLNPKESQRLECVKNTGPVKIMSDVPIVASMRVAHFNGTIWNDFSEMMGLPASQLTTSYVFPWYNNANLDSQLRFANVTTSPAHVHVVIHGAEMPGSPFTLNPGVSSGQSFTGINTGPVKIISDVPIVASLRVIINNGSAGKAFSEMMGLPASQLTTSYVFPWYNNANLDTQLRVGFP